MNSFEKNRLELALRLARRGWYIFPCHSISDGWCTCGRACRSPGKHPLTPRGFYDATIDLDLVRAIWEDTPWANIGLRTGPESGLWVLDVDGEDGIEQLRALESENGPLPPTPTARTGSGGLHHFFLNPSGLEIKSRTKIGGNSIDTRGSGGYVIAAGSNHPDGGYAWVVSPDYVPLAEAPDWLLRFVTEPQKKPAADTPGDFARGGEACEEVVFGVSPNSSLDTDPGVGEGRRHNRACELIGSALARGEDPETVMAKALDWAKRCHPPMDEGEVRRIVTDLAAKEEAAFEVDVESVTESRPWPVLDETALYGLAGEIVRAIEPSTEADSVAILGQFLAYFGNVIGRSAYFQVEDSRHYANLFTVLIGETAKGRKGTSEARVRELFRLVDPDWSKDRVSNGLSSGEGLIWAVRDPIFKTEAIKDKATGVVTGYQQVMTDPGVKDKRLLVRESEFATVLKVTRREGNTLSPLIREAWDTGDLNSLTKNSQARAKGAHISIVGHITKEELKRSMDDVEAFNGFANRFLWLCVRRSKLLPEGGEPVNLSGQIARLETAVEFGRRTERMVRDEEARRHWRKIYEEMAKPHPGLIGAVTSRGEAQVVRLSLVYALLDGSDVIGPEHLRAGVALWRYAEDSARYVFGDSMGDSLTDKVLKIIRDGPVTTKQIHDRTNRHYRKEEIGRALRTLKGMNLIKSEKVATGGRPAERWALA
jgi:hypothetical protein